MIKGMESQIIKQIFRSNFNYDVFSVAMATLILYMVLLHIIVILYILYFRMTKLCRNCIVILVIPVYHFIKAK